MTPFRESKKNQLNDSQKDFNGKLGTVRAQIEHAFDLLKRRFRQLYFCKLTGMETIIRFIQACVVLHNLSRTSEVELFEMEQVPK